MNLATSCDSLYPLPSFSLLGRDDDSPCGSLRQVTRTHRTVVVRWLDGLLHVASLVIGCVPALPASVTNDSEISNGRTLKPCALLPKPFVLCMWTNFLLSPQDCLPCRAKQLPFFSSSACPWLRLCTVVRTTALDA